MNKLLSLSIISVIGFAVGCSKQEAVKSPPQAVVQEPNPAQIIAQPMRHPRRIMGAFGWLLGQTIPNSYQLHQEDDGSLDLNNRSTNFPPFDGFGIVALEDRRVYAITASRYGVTTEQEEVVLSALTNKYGPAKLQFDKNDATQTARWTIDDGYADLSLDYSINNGYLTLYYCDHELEKIRNEKKQRIKEAKILQISTNL